MACYTVCPMPGRPTAAQIREFAGRRWDLVRAAKKQHWAGRARTMTATERIALSSSMWAHARSVDPLFPSDALRAEDLRHHRELAQRLRRVAHVFASR